MKYIGRAIATIVTMAGCVAIAYFIKDGCTIAACMIVCMFFIWAE